MWISEDSSNLIEFLYDLLIHCDEDVYSSRQNNHQYSRASTLYNSVLTLFLVSTSHVDYQSVKINFFLLSYIVILKIKHFVHWGDANIFKSREVTYCK